LPSGLSGEPFPDLPPSSGGSWSWEFAQQGLLMRRTAELARPGCQASAHGPRSDAPGRYRRYVRPAVGKPAPGPIAGRRSRPSAHRSRPRAAGRAPTRTTRRRPTFRQMPVGGPASAPPGDCDAHRRCGEETLSLGIA
jgi:hypothetical protein